MPLLQEPLIHPDRELPAAVAAVHQEALLLQEHSTVPTVTLPEAVPGPLLRGQQEPALEGAIAAAAVAVLPARAEAVPVAAEADTTDKNHI